MTATVTPTPARNRARPAFGGQPALWLAALLAGLLIAFLPLRYSLALLGGGALLVAALVQPLIGLGAMLLIGLAEPLLGAAGLLPFPVGQAGFGLFALGWLGRGLSRRSVRWPSLPISRPFFFYLLACALSVFFTQPPSPLDAFTELLKWVEMYLIAGMAADLAGREKARWVVAVLLFVGLVQAGIGLWQFQFRNTGPEAFRILGDHYRAYGTLEQPNPFGGFMGLVWPVAAALAAHYGMEMLRAMWGTRIARSVWIHADNPVNYSQRESAFNTALACWCKCPRNLRSVLTLSLITLATLGALVVSFSRGAWLGAAAAGLVMLVFWPRRLWVGLGLSAAGLVGLLTLYNLNLLPSFIASRFADVGDFVQVYDVRGVHINDSNFSIVERVAHWQAALRMADARPLFGVGFGNYEAAYPEYRLVNWQYGLGHAHNIYLNVLAETGAVGLAAYLLLWGSVIVLTVKAIRQTADGGRSSAVGRLSHPLALGLLGCWVHLATHQFLDNLYVGNISLYIGALLGLLGSVAPPAGTSSTTETAR